MEFDWMVESGGIFYWMVESGGIWLNGGFWLKFSLDFNVPWNKYIYQKFLVLYVTNSNYQEVTWDY